MNLTREREQLKRFITFILGRNPYEFGLVPDEEDFVKKKDLIKAIQEEKGWSHIRQSNLDELVVALPDPGFEIDDLRIRASDRQYMIQPVVSDKPPKLLFTGIRSKAHRHAVENGLQPYDNAGYIILTSDRETAERIGKRKDPRPIILTVNVNEAENLGVIFLSAGDTFFLARKIPEGCFSYPPLPAAETETSKNRKQKEEQRKNTFMPGSFVPDFSDRNNKKQSKEDKTAWKHNKKRIRREKHRFNDDF